MFWRSNIQWPLQTAASPRRHVLVATAKSGQRSPRTCHQAAGQTGHSLATVTLVLCFRVGAAQSRCSLVSDDAGEFNRGACRELKTAPLPSACTKRTECHAVALMAGARVLLSRGHAYFQRPLVSSSQVQQWPNHRIAVQVSAHPKSACLSAHAAPSRLAVHSHTLRHTAALSLQLTVLCPSIPDFGVLRTSRAQAKTISGAYETCHVVVARTPSCRERGCPCRFRPLQPPSTVSMVLEPQLRIGARRRIC